MSFQLDTPISLAQGVNFSIEKPNNSNKVVFTQISHMHGVFIHTHVCIFFCLPNSKHNRKCYYFKKRIFHKLLRKIAENYDTNTQSYRKYRFCYVKQTWLVLVTTLITKYVSKQYTNNGFVWKKSINMIYPRFKWHNKSNKKI